ncbi:MAG: preprotein translocase subunit SecG [Bacteroides sp.]|nr:preprotein translocase subunit SecG [Bacteroides sp.]MCM1550505.1 preprotein translocase subunit SecG [Clostridium sp.]
MKLALTIVFLVLAVIMAVLILFQEGKTNGLSGSIGGGSSETYWSKNKGRSKESKLITITTVLTVLFFVLSLVLSLGIIK